MSATGSKAAAIVVYTALRLGLFLAVWLTFELLTPVSGLWAIVLAILISGAISIVVLDRPRNRVGQVADGFFGRLNERIEASARAEDDDDEEPVPVRSSEVSDHREQGAEREAVGEQQEPGLLQGGDEGGPARPA
jgi:hypothetical protein